MSREPTQRHTPTHTPQHTTRHHCTLSRTMYPPDLPLPILSSNVIMPLRSPSRKPRPLCAPSARGCVFCGPQPAARRNRRELRRELLLTVHRRHRSHADPMQIPCSFIRICTLTSLALLPAPFENNRSLSPNVIRVRRPAGLSGLPGLS
jgi:hypothetical protein